MMLHLEASFLVTSYPQSLDESTATYWVLINGFNVLGNTKRYIHSVNNSQSSIKRVIIFS